MNNKLLQPLFNNALNSIYDILNEVAIEIVKELKIKLTSSNYKISIRRGYKPKFLNYIWISIKDIKNKKSYSINLFYNDINKDSGNPRTQLGRIQCWKDVIEVNKKIPSPHMCSFSGENITLEFLGKKAYDPKQAIYDGTYDPIELVNKFINEYKL